MLAALLLSAAQISPDPLPGAEDSIIITASLVPVPENEAPASVTLFGEQLLEALGLPLVSDVVRLAPGISVSTSGARGTETVVRIRGAESNHSLLFIDGIAFNDVAAANAARFDTLASGGLGRIEVIRGPQSALWGSEALGGVISLSSPDPLGPSGFDAAVEAGSRDWRSLVAELSSGGERAGLSATLSWARSEGIDILGKGQGDLDGFENLSLGVKAAFRLGSFEGGAVGRHIDHEIRFDGFDPSTFQRADTQDQSRARTSAGRVWLGFDDGSGWNGRVEFQHLGSRNDNRIAAIKTARSRGDRTRYGARLARRLGFGSTQHDLIVAVEREEEDFSTRDLVASTPLRTLSRARTALVGEWRARWGEWLVTDLAVRHDDFSHFADDLTIRAQSVADIGRGLALLVGYGEGIAQPSFTDLFGYPGLPFVGNPDLMPERSKGLEAGLRWRGSNVTIEAILFSNDLKNEIQEDFSVFPATVVNSDGTSRRRGLELSGRWKPDPRLELGANYTWLRSLDEEGVREIRRPNHSANLFAAWIDGPLSAGASIALVGRRTDRDFDLFPAPLVQLDSYGLASLRLAYRLHPALELHGRVENGFDSRYQDVFGYDTPGRSVHAGLRVSLGR